MTDVDLQLRTPFCVMACCVELCHAKTGLDNPHCVAIRLVGQ